MIGSFPRSCQTVKQFAMGIELLGIVEQSTRNFGSRKFYRYFLTN